MPPVVPEVPHPGDVVRVRTRTYVCEDVIPRTPLSSQSWVQLACLDDDAQGEPLEVVWELEFDTEIIGRGVWQSLGQRGFDAPRWFSAIKPAFRGATDEPL